MSYNNSSDDQMGTEGGRHNKRRFQPFYNDKGDYATNAPSYYDFLARPNYWWKYIGKLINRLVRRDVLVKETPTITMVKDGDWQEEGQDNITLSANLHVSKHVGHDDDMGIDVPNAVQELEDGLYIAEWKPAIVKNHNDIVAIDKRTTVLEGDVQKLKTDVSKLQTDVTVINQEIQTINQNIKVLTDTVQGHTTMLSKLIDNLIKTGAWSGSRLEGNLVVGRDIATGNINIYSGQETANNAIKTHQNPQDNDIKAGL